MKSVGQQLRDERLKKGLSLKSLSMTTKIREDQLVKIEKDEFNKLHGPTYVRGFVRNYATALGLNVRTLLSELEHVLEMEGENSYLSLGVINYVPEETKPKREFRPQSLFLGFAGVLLLMIIGVFVYKVYQIGFVSARSAIPVATDSDTLSPETKTETTTIKKALPVDGTIVAPAVAVVAESAVNPGVNQLTLLAKEECWVRVSIFENEQPKVILEEVLPMGKQYALPSAPKYLVKLNPPVAVEMLVNGKKYDHGSYNQDSPPIELLVPSSPSN